MNTEEFMKALKSSLKDPDFKDTLKNLLEDESEKSSAPKKEMKVFEINDSDIPLIERNAAKKIKSVDGYLKKNRDPIQTVMRRCHCGASERISKGSALDRKEFLCNSCQRG
jgi:hypothetical protein